MATARPDKHGAISVDALPPLPHINDGSGAEPYS